MIHNKRKIYWKLYFLIFLSFSSVSLSQNSFDTFEELNKHSKEIDSLLSLGKKNIISDEARSLLYLHEAAEISKFSGKVNKIIQANILMGLTFLHASELDSAFHKLKYAQELAEIVQDSVSLGLASTYLGEYYKNKNQFFLAISNLMRAWKIFRRKNYYDGLVISSIELAKVYLFVGKNKTAKAFIGKVFRRYWDKTEIDRWKFSVYKTSAEVYYQLKDSLMLKEQIGSIEKLSKTDNNLIINGYYYFYKAKLKLLNNKYEDAINLFKEALNISKRKSIYLNIFSNLGISNSYAALHNTDSAYYYSKISSKLSKEKGYYLYYLLSLGTKLKIATIDKNIKEVSYLTSKILSVRDSLINIENKLRNKEFLSLLKLNEITKNNLTLQRNVSTQKFIVKFLLASFMLLIAFSVLFYLQRKKIKKSNYELKQSIEDKNKLFSIIAHDLKNPFNSLLGYSDLLLDELEGDYSIVEVKDGISQMRSATQNLLDMVENLLQWARSQTGQIKFTPTYFNLNEIVLQVYTYFTQSARIKGIELKLRMPAEAKCYCDKNMIATILRNLVGNSIKFCREGDYIKISIEKDKINGKIYLIHEDSGIGMTKEQVDKLFSKSITTKGTGGEKGTGIGMFLVKEMVDKNRGEIFVDSKPGVGTKFTIILPMNKE